MISITISNTDSQDLFVQVWDLNQPGSPQVLNSRINQGSSQPLQVQDGSDGNGNINWAALAANNPTPGQVPTTSQTTPSDGDTVNVTTWQPV
jgi:hypothetical protein